MALTDRIIVAIVAVSIVIALLIVCFSKNRLTICLKLKIFNQEVTLDIIKETIR